MVKIWRPDLDYGWGEGEIVPNEQGIIFQDGVLRTPTGRLVSEDFSELKMTVSFHPPEIQSDYFTCGSMLMMSPPLKEVLDDFRVKVQYIPFGIILKDNEVADRVFCYCNILDVVECFDLERGEYTFWQKEGFYDHVDHIKKLVINEKEAASHHLFRVAKGGEHIVCVSDALAHRIEKGGFRGITFVSPEEWTLC